MAKQKSGLGRGLNALFDDAAPLVSKPASQKKEEEQKAPASPEQPKQGSGVTSSPSQPAVETPRRPSSDIYISEDALENAQVVSREARKPVSRPVEARPSRSVSGFAGKQAVGASAAATSAQGHASTQQPHGAAIPGKPAPEAKKDSKGEVGMIPLDKIVPNPDQPRTNFRPEEIEELAGSIKREGLLQPILVRKVGDHYQIIAGERRWQACKTIGMKEIPVRFWYADNDKALELALIENIQRTDLNPIEEAYGYKRLMERKGMTQSEVAQTVSKGRSTIANALRLLDLPEEAQQLLFEEKITAGHARAILSIPTAEGRKTLTAKLMNEKLSVRETEAIARLLSGRAKAEEQGATKRVPAPASFKKAARGLTRFLSVPVRVKTVQGKNKIEIQFKDEEELERILALIGKSTDAS